MEKPTKPCWACGSSDWRLAPDGQYLCAQCHPPTLASPRAEGECSPEVSAKGEYSPEVLALRSRVIAGNKKLRDAWDRIIEMEPEEREREKDRWQEANVKLQLLCTELKSMGYEDCLYLDGQGRKVVQCLRPGIGCRVCPSKIPYWGQELMELPGGGAG